MTQGLQALNQSQIEVGLRGFLLSILPTGVQVVEGNNNRVPEPLGDFVVYAPTSRTRLSTNFVAYADVVFTGSIAGTTLNVTSIRLGSIISGALLWGVGVTTGTTIVSQTGGTTGGVGTYTVSASQTVSSEEMASGAMSLTQPTLVRMQLDVHGAARTDPSFVHDASDLAQLISTLARSEVATAYFDAMNAGVSIIHADDPKFVPYLNAEQQYEFRYVVDCDVEANQVVSWPQQFMDGATVVFVPADGNP